jgi:hypothetical protein
MKATGKAQGQHLVGRHVLADDGAQGRVTAFDGEVFTITFAQPQQAILFLSSDDMIGWSFCETEEQRDNIFAQREWEREAFSAA